MATSNIRKRANGMYEARVTVGYDPKTGKPQRKSLYARTQTEVARKLHALQSQIDTGEYCAAPNMSCEDFFHLWLKEGTAHLAASTLTGYKRRMNYYIVPVLGRIKLSKLTKLQVQRFCNGLQERDKPLSAKSIRNIHGVLSKALEYAIEIGYLSKNPASGVSLPKVVRAEIVPLSQEHIKLFLQEIRGHRFEYIYLLTLFTGLREGEVLGLQWRHINLDNGYIKVCHQLQKVDGEYKLVPPKHDKTRTVPLPLSMVELLKKQQALQTAWKQRAGETWADNDLVFTTQLGTHLVSETVYRNYKRIVANIGIPNARFHDLRHTYAVNALSVGENIKALQSNLGHHSAAFTLDVYAHVSSEMVQSSAQKMQTYIDSILFGRCNPSGV